MNIMLEKVLLDHFYGCARSVAVSEDDVVSIGLADALYLCDSRCMVHMKEAIGENANVDDYTLLQSGNLFVAYPNFQKALGLDGLARMVFGGYVALQRNMKLDNITAVIFLKREVTFEEMYGTDGLIKLGIDSVDIGHVWDTLFCLTHSLLARKHDAGDMLWVCARARVLGQRDVVKQIETLVRAYLATEATKAMGISPYLSHLISAEYDNLVFMCDSEQNMEDFFKASRDVLIGDQNKPSAKLLGSFFHFLCEKMEMGHYEYFLHLLNIFRNNAISFREVVTLSALSKHTKWGELGDEWSSKMYDTTYDIVQPPRYSPFTVI